MISWRQYFKDQELEEAYQHVEVDKLDDPLDSSSEGSSENPSEDNFDIKEMYEKIYEITNLEAIEQERLHLRARFAEEIQ